MNVCYKFSDINEVVQEFDPLTHWCKA